MFSLKDIFPKRSQVIGIDVGSSSLKLLDIKDSPRGPELIKFGQIAMPRGAIVNGELLEPGVLSDRLVELVSSCGCKRRPVVSCLSGNSVLVKKVNFNQMGEEELRELLQDEGAKYLPFEDISHVYLDFQVLKGSDVNPNQMEVLIVAAKKDVVDSYTQAFLKAGLEVVIMDVDSYAIETMYEENYDFDDDEVVALIDIGASATNINVLKGGISIFTRSFSLGGNIITEAIGRELGVAFDEAELIKITGVSGETAEREKLREKIIIEAESIIQEIESSLDYLKFQAREFVKQIVLSGGSATIADFDRVIADRLNMAASIVDPFRKIHVDPQKISPTIIAAAAPFAAVGVGLALRRLGDR